MLFLRTRTLFHGSKFLFLWPEFLFLSTRSLFLIRRQAFLGPQLPLPEHFLLSFRHRKRAECPLTRGRLRVAALAALLTVSVAACNSGAPSGHLAAGTWQGRITDGPFGSLGCQFFEAGTADLTKQ